jgi:aspartyl-tRNA(Asn)/glutamyl-tRNA(Gln) amidotransferase subunit A
MPLWEEPTHRLCELLRAGEVTAVELTQCYLDRIAAHDRQIGAYLHVDRDRALQQAEASDARRRSGASIGLLEGLPIAIKDVVCESGAPTTCASKMLQKLVSPYDAHVVERLRQAGAVLLGRTNMDEFAMGSSCENSAFQVTRNPWDMERTPGGSSGGSAAAVGGRLAPLALGSDTGGSIRQPAAFCGIVGLKPTYGRVSRYGLIAYASSLDQIGPMAPDVYGTALLLEVLAGHDRRDSTSVERTVPRYTQQLDQPMKGLRVGVAKEHFAEGLDPEIATAVRQAIDVLKNQGAEVREIELPHSRYCVAVYYIVAPSEASSNLSRYDGVHYGHRAAGDHDLIDMYAASRAEGFGEEVQRRIMLGTYALSAGYYDAYYNKALKVRRLIREDFDRAFEKVDVIAGPVTPATAFKLGEFVDDPLSMYLLDIYTVSANLAGLPAISLPCGLSSAGLPIGLQLTAAPFEEARLLNAAAGYERASAAWQGVKCPLK